MNIDRKIDRSTDKQTDRHTNRQTDRQTVKIDMIYKIDGSFEPKYATMSSMLGYGNIISIIRPPKLD